MIDAAMPYLRCPVCDGTLARAGERTLRCPRGHSFDIARQGYASLTRRGTPHEGDSAAMIEDRAAFLAAGHYDFIAEALTGSVAAAEPAGLVVDAGTGTGFYLAHVLEALPGWSGLGLDVSKPALRRAARAHPRAAAVLADLWQPHPAGRRLRRADPQRLRPAQRTRVPPHPRAPAARSWWSPRPPTTCTS